MCSSDLVSDTPRFLLTTLKSHHEVVLLSTPQRVMHEMAMRPHPDTGCIPFQIIRKIFFIDDRAVHHMPSHSMAVANVLRTHNRSNAISRAISAETSVSSGGTVGDGAIEGEVAPTRFVNTERTASLLPADLRGELAGATALNLSGFAGG